MCDGKTAYRDSSSCKLDDMQRKVTIMKITFGIVVVIATSVVVWLIFHKLGLV